MTNSIKTRKSHLDPQFKDALLVTTQESSPDGILVTGLQGEVVSFNQKFVDIWDISPHAVAIHSHEAVQQAMLDRVADTENFIAVVNYLHKHQTERNQEDILLKDGRTLERYSAAMFGQSREYYGRVWYFRDITELKRTEKALRDSAGRLKIATDSGQMAVWEYNMLTEELIWDDACLALYKLSRKKFSGTFKEWAERIHPQDIVATVTRFQQALASGMEYNSEYRILWPNNEVRYIKVHGRVIGDQHGNPLYMIGTNWDITDLKQTEAALRSREGHLKLATASGQVGIWEYNLQTSELIWDDNMFALYGARREDFSGAYDAWATRLHPDDLASAELVLQAAIYGNGIYEPEFRIIWPDGEVRYIKGHAQVIKDDTGNPVYIMGSNWDDTAHARTQQQLHLAHTAIDVSRSEFYRVSPTGMVLYANDAACQCMGYGRDELIGMYVWEFNPDMTPDTWPELWQELRQTRVVNLETRHRRKDGKIFPVEVVGNIIAAEGEEYSFVFVQDISERKQVEMRLRHLTKLYKSLSEINQAIVRMEQESELLPLVCRCAVLFGGMRMAFVALLDEKSGTMVPTASYGNRQDYLEDIIISSRADVPEGRGSCGTALRENRPVIINDYLSNALTLPWRQRGINCGWKSIAAIPIPRGGKPYAVLNVFHEQVDAFDEEVIALLEQLSKNISFALDNFDRQMQCNLAEECLLLAASVYDTSREAIMVTDADNHIVAINPAFTSITGYFLEAVVGKHPDILSSCRHDEAFYLAVWHEIDTTGRWQGEIWAKHKNGEVCAVYLTVNTIFNQDGSIHRRVSLFSDITDRKKTEELVWHQANFDFLTGLPNRRMFHDRLEQELKKAHRVGLPLALMFIDLDRFKEINDTLGHDMGDALLKEASQRLTSCVRDTDTISRLGGDEFTVILGELDDLGSVDRIAQNVLQKLAESFRLGDEVAYISASIGITLYPEDATTVDALIKNADQAMYAAKNQGRNRYHYFTQSMQKTAQQRMRLVNDLRKALTGQQFRVYYQPIVELATGAIHKAEALIRWLHPTRGLISPADFIPIAEETGLIMDIGEWVFHQAAHQVGHWREFHDATFQISVNKSPVQFRNEDRSHGSWLVHLESLGLPGQCIVVEITEGLLLDTGTTVTDRLLEFRNAGMQVSLDDFGTGYSSLSYLKKFDIDFLKIDQSFVRNLEPGSSDLALCEAIIVMAHKLGMKVIAEGIETEQQRELLAVAGCDYGQGHLFSEPVPADKFEILLGKQGKM